MNKYLTFLIVFLLSLSFTYAVIEETNTYRIECSPDVASIQAQGFHQTCSYLLKHGTYTGDVAFCFDTTIKNAKVIFNNNQDITSLFKFKHYNMVKGECYYIEDVTFVANVSKKLDIYYLPNNLSASPKWDTYFGDVSTNRIDLMLDPVYNLSLYQIGTSIDSSYYWSVATGGYYDSVSGGTFKSKTNNSDINLTNAYLVSNKASTNNSYYYNINTTGVGSPNNLSGGFTLAYNQSVNHELEFIEFYTYMSGYCDSGNYQQQYIVVKYSGESPVSVGSWATGGGSSTCRVKTISVALDPSKNVEYYEVYQNINLNNRYGGIYNVSAIYGDNVTRASANLTSNLIPLPILVNNYRINASFVGSAFINITFDGINYRYLNLSNSTQVNLSDDITDNNNMSYKILLLNNATTIYNVSLIFNGIANWVTINIFNELTNSVIAQNVTVTMTDLTVPSLSTIYITTGNQNFTNLTPNHVLKFTFTSANFSTRSYILTVSQGSAQVLNAYLLANNLSSTIGIYTKSLTDNIIAGATISIQKLVNTSYIGVSQGVTDGTGFSTFSLQEGTNYRVLISADNFNVYQTDLVPYLANSPYTFKLAPTSSFVFTTLNDYVKYSYSPMNSIINKSNENFTLTTYSINGSILYTYINCEGSIQNVSGSPLGSTVSVNLNITSSSLITCMYAFDVVESGYYSFNVTYRGFTETNTSIKASAKIVKDSTNQVWLTLLSYIIMLVVVIGIKQNYPDTRITGVILCVGTIFFVAIGWIDYIAGGVSATIGLLLLYVGSR